jgi:hypothetical protein
MVLSDKSCRARSGDKRKILYIITFRATTVIRRLGLWINTVELQETKVLKVEFFKNLSNSLGSDTGLRTEKQDLQMWYVVSKCFYSPTDAQVNCLKSNSKICIKIYIKTAPTCYGAVTPSSESALLVHSKVTLVKNPIKIHRCVVMWLHILVGYFNNCNFRKHE